MLKALQAFVQYITEGFARIFSPSDDEYPEVGVQPFDSEPYVSNESKS
jgi:hypothetical protein